VLMWNIYIGCWWICTLRLWKIIKWCRFFKYKITNKLLTQDIPETCPHHDNLCFCHPSSVTFLSLSFHFRT
jgi:hypothetical protein